MPHTNLSENTITPQLLLSAYQQGIFPMADHRQGDIRWYSPDPRAVLPLDHFHIPKSLARRIRRSDYIIQTDTAFAHVIRQCAQKRQYADETWINEDLINAYTALHNSGYAHSIEIYNHQDLSTATGGLYGVAVGGVFFGESMFSRATDASKICLVYLVNHLRERGYTLLDTQFSNAHMQRFGTIEISRTDFLDQLHKAIDQPITWGNQITWTRQPEQPPTERSEPETANN